MNKLFSPEKQQLCVEVPLEHALQLQALLTCPEVPTGKFFPPEVYEQVDETVWADGTPVKVVNIQPIKINLKKGCRPQGKNSTP